MAHTISVSDETFAQMQALAIPLVDTPDSIIARALTALEANGETPREAKSGASARSFNPAAPPSLSHTTPKSITLCGTKFRKSETHWNGLMIAAIREAARRGKTAEEINQILTINSLVGRKEDNGYRYIPDVGVSVQGQDANAAWRQTYEIASKLGFGIDVEFTWQNNPKAAMPNTHGRFSVGSVLGA